MQKKWFLLLIIGILVIICIGTFAFLNSSCILTFGFTNKQACLVDKAVKTSDFEICEKSASPMWCYQDVAKELKDEEICKRINDEKFSSNCIIQIAVIKKDITLCEKINNSMQYGCLVEVNK